jgi:hypothetical protein
MTYGREPHPFLAPKYGDPYPYYGGATTAIKPGEVVFKDGVPVGIVMNWTINPGDVSLHPAADFATLKPEPASVRTVRRRFELAPAFHPHVFLAWLLAIAYVVAWLMLS